MNPAILAALAMGISAPSLPTPRQAENRKRRARTIYGRLVSWDRLKAAGWTENGRGDRINPERSRRRRWAAKFTEITGRRLTGRQYKRLLRGKLPPQKLPVIT